MKVVLLTALLFAGTSISFESGGFNAPPPLIPLRRSRRKLISGKTMATFGAAAAGGVALSMLMGDSKSKLLEERTKLQFSFNLLDDEKRRLFTDRTATIGELHTLTGTALEELEGIEIDCAAKIEDIKAVVNGASRQQNTRINKVLGTNR